MALSFPAKDRESVPVSGGELMQALESQKTSLTALHMKLHGGDLYIDEGRTKLDNFTSLKQLQLLCIEQSCLSNTPELPETLEMLVIENYDEPIFDLMEFLVGESQTRLHSFDMAILKPLLSPCPWMLDIFPAPDKEKFYNDEVLREQFKDRVEELELIAHELIVQCECYRECVAMLDREYAELGSKESSVLNADEQS